MSLLRVESFKLLLGYRDESWHFMRHVIKNYKHNTTENCKNDCLFHEIMNMHKLSFWNFRKFQKFYYNKDSALIYNISLSLT